MEKLIKYSEFRKFAYSNDHLCREVKGIVVKFNGLGNKDIVDEDPAIALALAELGIVYLIPYNNPWCWMNGQAIAYTDELIDVLLDHYGLGDGTPIVSSGGSMGGQSAIVYTRYSKRTPRACVVNCPVCDMVFHFGERRDLPRTLYSAFWQSGGTMEEALAAHSPIHLAESLPRVPYHVFHCNADRSVNIERHSERFVARMRELGHEISFDVVSDRGHCDLDEPARAKYDAYCIEAIFGK